MAIIYSFARVTRFDPGQVRARGVHCSGLRFRGFLFLAEISSVPQWKRVQRCCAQNMADFRQRSEFRKLTLKKLSPVGYTTAPAYKHSRLPVCAIFLLCKTMRPIWKAKRALDTCTEWETLQSVSESEIFKNICELWVMKIGRLSQLLSKNYFLLLTLCHLWILYAMSVYRIQDNSL